MFDQLVVSSAVRSKTNKRWTVALSAAGQTFLLGLLVLAPLVYTEALPNGMLKTILVAPPPPTAPVPQPARPERVRVVPLSHLSAPRTIPTRIETATNEPPVVYADSLASSDAGIAGLSELLHPAALPAPPARAEQKPLDGAIEELSYVSGPPLLLKAAMDAVKQWRYRPTLLNNEPVEVETTIDVVFNLGG